MNTVKRTIRSLVVVVTMAITIAGVAGGGLAVALDHVVAEGSWIAPQTDQGLIVTLVIGTDEGPPHRPGDPLTGRADGIHLMIVDPESERMTVVDVPRDSYIGGSKVNAYLAYGGPERLVGVLEEWSGLQIQYWILGSFWSVEQMATTLGGVTVDVPQRMHDRFSGTDLQPGVQVLDPVQALAFSRDRKSLSNGDFGRTANQTTLLLGALAQIKTNVQADPHEALRLVAELRRVSASNISLPEMVYLADVAVRLDPANIEQVSLSGPIGSAGGQSIVRVQAGEVFERALAGQVGPQQPVETE